MYYQSYGTPCDYCYREMLPKSYIRLLHASPDAPGVDVYANGKLLTRNLNYRGFTPYMALDSGNYNIKVFPTGKTSNPVIDTNLTIPPNQILTVAAIGKLNNIGLLPIPDPKLPREQNKAYARFVHLSPNAPNVDITLPNGNKLFTDVQYREITNYIPVNPGTYELQARPTGTSQVILQVPNINLKPNRFYTVYAIGLADGQPSLQVLIPLDGNSYL